MLALNRFLCQVQTYVCSARSAQLDPHRHKVWASKSLQDISMAGWTCVLALPLPCNLRGIVCVFADSAGLRLLVCHVECQQASWCIP